MDSIRGPVRRVIGVQDWYSDDEDYAVTAAVDQVLEDLIYKLLAQNPELVKSGTAALRRGQVAQDQLKHS